MNLVIMVTAAFAVISCTKKVKLDTDQKKASYAIGMQLGKNLKDAQIDFDPEALLQAMKDVKEGKPQALSQEELGKAMQNLQQSAQKKQAESAEENKKKGDDFLAENKSKPNVKTTASGLQYLVEKEGTGKSPKETDEVKVHYTGTLIDGTKFDSSVDRGQPAEFPVNGVIKGWTEALQLMKEGSKYKLFIPSDLAYGPMARPGIPPNSVLQFDVELLEVKKAHAAAELPSKKVKKVKK
ncbi:MAG: FKBP-type peptidyl-prolyl cis-trans isomerase [Bdellovibrionales bacterium]|nr:FKBP-type peptidyl-prolyl cis-trans isomerase [Bdellovibrionales bacterium]